MTVDKFGDAYLDSNLLTEHLAYWKGDNAWQQRARLRQSLWRDEMGWPTGTSAFGKGNDPEHRATMKHPPKTDPLGWRLREEQAYAYGNFLTDAAVEAVKWAQLHQEKGAMLKEDRLLGNLLSSQPLCFNLFGDLRANLDDAAAVMGALLPQLQIASVQDILFEHSPGRRVEKYGNDRSAFDVAIKYTNTSNEAGLIGIEVKYHEDPASKETVDPGWGAWCEEVAVSNRAEIECSPLVQLARDHRLARKITEAGDYPAGAVWVLMYPHENTAMRQAADRYLELTQPAADRRAITLEQFLAAVMSRTNAPWPALVQHRYLREMTELSP